MKACICWRERIASAPFVRTATLVFWPDELGSCLNIVLFFSAAHYNHTWGLWAAAQDLMCAYKQQARVGHIWVDTAWHCRYLSFLLSSGDFPHSSSFSHPLVSRYTFFQTLTVVNSFKLSCSNKKTLPSSEYLELFLLSHVAKYSGLWRPNKTETLQSKILCMWSHWLPSPPVAVIWS